MNGFPLPPSIIHIYTLSFLLFEEERGELFNFLCWMYKRHLISLVLRLRGFCYYNRVSLLLSFDSSIDFYDSVYTF